MQQAEPSSSVDGVLATFRLAEAAFRLSPSELTRPVVVARAVDLLMSGLDTPNLRVLAGEDDAETNEVMRYLDATVADLALEPLDHRASVLTMLDAIARDLVDGRLEPKVAAHRLWAAWVLKAWDEELGPEAQSLAYAADSVEDFWGEPYGATVNDLRDAAQTYVDRVQSSG